MGYNYTKNADGQFTCHQCEYTAKYQSTMHYHLKKHEGILPHACTQCNSKFAQKALLDLHTKAKHSNDEKEYHKCPCKGCSYKDLRKANLTIHFARIHLKDIIDKLKTNSTEENAVCSCNKCNKSFKSMTHYYYHSASCISLAPVHPLAPLWTQVCS